MNNRDCIMSMSNLTLLILTALLLTPLMLSGPEIDLRPQWDETIPLANPHKGWYHHFFDNTVDKYLLESDAELTDFPGMDHIYLRLAGLIWSRQEGRFNWSVVDGPIAKWTGAGLGIAFRISCKETGTNRVEQQFATLRWVRTPAPAAGTTAAASPKGPDAPWEPVFDDPVFLAELENFLAAFAARSDGQPWLRHVDIGSFGDSGEGHTLSGSRPKYGYAVLEAAR